MAIIIKKGGIPDLSNGPVTATVTFYQETALPMIISNLPAGEHSIGRVELISGTVVITVSIDIIVPLGLNPIIEGEAISSAIVGSATASNGSLVTRVVEYRINNVVANGSTIGVAGQTLTATAYFTNGQVQTAPVSLGPVTIAAIDNSGVLEYTTLPTQGSLTKITAGDTSDQVIAKTYSGVVTRTPNGPIAINPVLIVDGVPFVGAFSTGQVLNSIVFNVISDGAESIQRTVTVNITVEAVPVTPVEPTVTINYSEAPFLGSFEYATNGDTVASILLKMDQGNPVASNGATVTVTRRLFIGANEVQGTVKTGDVLTRATFSATAPGVETPVIQELLFSSTVLAAQSTTPVGEPAFGGPYTLAQVERLKTNKSTNGRQSTAPLKIPGVNALPTGVSWDSVNRRLTFGSGAVDNARADGRLQFTDWDLKDVNIVANSGCKVNFTQNFFHEEEGITSTIAAIIRYAGSDFRINWNTIRGAMGKLDNRGKGTAIHDFVYVSSNPADPPRPIPSDTHNNRIIGWPGDGMKVAMGRAIQNYFGPAVNLHKMPVIYNSGINHPVGELVWSTVDGYTYRILANNIGVPLPTTIASTNWTTAQKAAFQNIDPHGDSWNPYIGGSVANIAAIGNYFERNINFGVDGELDGGAWARGQNNAIRATANSGSQAPAGGILAEYNIATDERRSQSYAFDAATQGDQPLWEPNTFRNNWVELKGTSNSPFHPSALSKQPPNTIENTMVYTRPAASGQAGTALQFTLRQSQGSFITNSGSFYQVLPYPEITKPVLTLYTAQGAENTVGPLEVVPVTNTNKSQYNPGMAVLNNALAHAAPGWEFVLAEGDEAGSSHVPFFKKTVVDGVAKERVFKNTKDIYEAALAAYPNANKRLNVYWTTSDERFLYRWKEAVSPGYFKQYADGTPYTYGTNHIYYPAGPTTAEVSAPINASLYDFNTASPTDKGTGVFDRTVAIDIQRLEGLANDSTSRITGYDTWIADPRIAATGGKPFAAASWGYYHADPADRDQLFLGALQYHMATFLRAANIPVDEATFGQPVFAADLSYADVPFIAGNGGVLKTRRKLLNIPLPAGDTSQEVWGFELEPITGGGLFLFGRVGGAVPARYQATVTILNDTTVRITPVQPFQQGDKITFQKGYAYYRTDLKGTIEHRVLGPSKNSLSFPIEHRPALTDLTAVYPFDGFPVSVRKGPWTVPDVSTGTGGGGSTPTEPTVQYFTTGPAGPVYAAPLTPGAGITKVQYRARIYVPDTVVFNSVNGKLWSQSNIGFDVRFNSTAGTHINVLSIKDGASTTVLTSKNVATTLPRNQWYDIGLTANMSNSTLYTQINSATVTTIPFDVVSNGSIQSTRKFYILGRSDGLDTLPEGIRFEYLEIYLNDVLYKRIDKTNANTDPWKLPASSNAT